MTGPSATQLAWRNRLEAVLRLIEPGLNLMLAAGDRVSRIADRDALDRPAPARRVERSSLADTRRADRPSE